LCQIRKVEIRLFDPTWFRYRGETSPQPINFSTDFKAQNLWRIVVRALGTMESLISFLNKPKENLTIASGYSANNTIQFIRGGLPYFDLLVELIDRAQESIHLQVYIYEDDETGNRITKALVRAAQRGVAVFMLLDGYASNALTADTITEITKAGYPFPLV
jgi:phosphatidylserine/phosphatidylglycerophosphate/cardiolipin synthase-like enzyme